MDISSNSPDNKRLHFAYEVVNLFDHIKFAIKTKLNKMIFVQPKMNVVV